MSERICIPNEVLNDFGKMMRSCGVTHLSYSEFSGVKLVYTEGREDAAERGLELFVKYLRDLPDEAKRHFVEFVANRINAK